MNTNINLNYPTTEEIKRCMKIHKEAGGVNKNQKLRKLFKLFPKHDNYTEVKIKCVAINSIYNTAIRHIDPIVQNITETLGGKDTSRANTTEDWIKIIDDIRTVKSAKRKNIKENSFSPIEEENFTNHPSFASKYVHVASNFKTPIYDSFAWAMIAGYLKISEKATPRKPETFQQFHISFQSFKKSYKINNHCNYEIDKFLWHHANEILKEIEQQYDITRKQSKTKLLRELTSWKAPQEFISKLSSNI